MISREASVDQYFSDTRALAEAIEGMMSPFSMAAIDSLLAFQRLRGIGGDLLEMGVFRGKSAAVLARRMAPNETLHLYDIADYFDRDRLAKAGANIEFNVKNTADLSRRDFREKRALFGSATSTPAICSNRRCTRWRLGIMSSQTTAFSASMTTQT